MSDYRVSFFKNLVNSNGHRFKCLQERIDLLDIDCAEHATASAARQFEEHHGLRDWTLYADSIEVELVDQRCVGESSMA